MFDMFVLIMGFLPVDVWSKLHISVSRMVYIQYKICESNILFVIFYPVVFLCQSL